MVKSVTTWHLKCHGHSPSRFESAWRQRIETKQQAPKTKSSAAFFASRQSRGGLTWQPQNLTTHLTGAKPRLGDMLGQFRGGEAPRSIQKTLSWSKTSQPLSIVKKYIHKLPKQAGRSHFVCYLCGFAVASHTFAR